MSTVVDIIYGIFLVMFVPVSVTAIVLVPCWLIGLALRPKDATKAPQGFPVDTKHAGADPEVK